MEREEYTAETYPSFGKKYNGEKAIISLTSWKARINTVSKTIFSLIKQCPGFHIVLVLSEKEFPKMMDELPDDLMLFVKNNLIEILWVYKNYKSFKKVLFTIDKYRDAPVISADDDCIYTCNYAKELYDKWTKNKDCVISMSKSFGSGFGIIFNYKLFKNFKVFLVDKTLKTNQDDLFYRFLMIHNGLDTYIGLHSRKLLKSKYIFTKDEGISSKINEEKNILIFNKIFNFSLDKKFFGKMSI